MLIRVLVIFPSCSPRPTLFLYFSVPPGSDSSQTSYSYHPYILSPSARPLLDVAVFSGHASSTKGSTIVGHLESLFSGPGWSDKLSLHLDESIPEGYAVPGWTQFSQGPDLQFQSCLKQERAEFRVCVKDSPLLENWTLALKLLNLSLLHKIL